MENRNYDRSLILQCIQNAQNDVAENSSEYNGTNGPGSILLHYYKDNASITSISSSNTYREDDTVSTPSLHSELEDKSLSEREPDEESLNFKEDVEEIHTNLSIGT